LYGFLAWLEGSALGAMIRGSGAWAYGVTNLIHILGLATLFGAILVLDLRLLGCWRQVSLATLARPTVPLAAIGFCVASFSGLCLLSTNATDYAGNPFLLIKFPAIALGVVNVAVLTHLDAWKQREVREPTQREATQLAAVGGVSLACWLTAVSAGRLIGYW
jgi:hypothetical protein